MTLVSVAALIVFGIWWSLLLVWLFGRIARRAAKDAVVRQRLLERARQLPPKSAKREAAEQLRGALRYTEVHRREAKRQRAREAEAARVEAAVPAGAKAAADGFYVAVPGYADERGRWCIPKEPCR